MYDKIIPNVKENVTVTVGREIPFCCGDTIIMGTVEGITKHLIIFKLKNGRIVNFPLVRRGNET